MRGPRPQIVCDVHTGPAVERSGDWYCATVNLAASVAAGGEVLLTDTTRQPVGSL